MVDFEHVARARVVLLAVFWLLEFVGDEFGDGGIAGDENGRAGCRLLTLRLTAITCFCRQIEWLISLVLRKHF